MPAHRRQVRMRTTAARPLPRITDPYFPRLDDMLQTPDGIREEETYRVAHNLRVWRLQKIYEKAARAQASDVAAALWAYESEQQIYERRYGKFVPDCENAAWFAAKAPRVEAMKKARAAAGEAVSHDDPAMVLYLDSAKQFELDFGHAFSSRDAHDGLDLHFKRLASHASTAHGLHALFGDDRALLIEFASQPVTFVIGNPYPEGHQQRGAFNAKLRNLKELVDGFPPAASAASGAVEFSIVNPYVNGSFREVVRGHCEGIYVKQDLGELFLHHWEALNDCVGEKRENPYSPFVERAPLW